MTLEDARALDAGDPLAAVRTRFRIPEGIIYLDGNSLGALPAATPRRLSEVAEREWGEDLIAGWERHGWIDLPTSVAASVAPLLGAAPNQVLIADSTSVCLFKLLAAAVTARPDRRAIVTHQGNFPTDLYIAQGLVRLVPGLRLRAVTTEEIESAIGPDTAVVMLTHVDYRSGARHDMRAINRAAHAQGALTLWDLSHSAGAVAINLDEDGCDLAVGCGYKYLNGGPGAPAFIYVAERLHSELQSPLSGWMGHAEPFAFEDTYRPQQGITRFLTGTPSIIALAALQSGLASFEGVAMDAAEAKSRQLSQLFIDEVERQCGNSVRLASPRDPRERGSHVSFSHPEGYAVIQALIARGVIGDFREHDLMRFGFAPLYNSFEDAWRAAEMIGKILASAEWDHPQLRKRSRIT